MRINKRISYLLFAFIFFISGVTTVNAASCSSAGPDNDVTSATSGYRRTYAYGVSGAAAMYFPTWTDAGGQNDIVWYPGINSGGGTWYVDINLANHPDIGGVQVHVYMYDSSWNATFCDYANFSKGNASTGYLDTNNHSSNISCADFSGWAWDPDHPNSVINIRINLDGSDVATIPAGDYRGDLPGNHYHGFSYAMPVAWKNTQSHVVHMYAVDMDGNPSRELGYSPQLFVCAPPPVLTINTAGTGSGSTTGAGSYNYNMVQPWASPVYPVVTMGASPASGSVFSGWTGDADCADGVVTMSNNVTCTANFNAIVNGGWTDWSSWGSCSVSACGQTGTQTGTRACTNPSPAYGGTECLRLDGSRGLSETRSQSCSMAACSSNITSFSISPTTIPYNGTATLSYSCSNGYYSHIILDGSWTPLNDSGYFSSRTTAVPAQTSPGSHTAWAYCYNSDWIPSSNSWYVIPYTVSSPPTASCSVSPNPVPYGTNPGITLSSTNGYYCHVYNDWSNVNTGYFTSGTYYSGSQTPGSHQAQVYCYNSVWSGSGWSSCDYSVACPTPSYETQTLGCSTGYSGSITQRRDRGSAPSCSFGDWYTTSNTCTMNPPATPTGFVASPSSCNNNWLNLSWNASASATNYKVYRNGSLVYDSAGLAFSDTGLTLGSTYSYTIVASNAGGSSGAGSTSGTVSSLCSYTVSTSAGAGCSISPSSRTVSHGSATTFTITPNTGYTVSSASGCSGSLSGTNYTTGAITGNCSVSASCGINTYPISWTATNGSATPTSCVYGQTVTPACSPNTGYYTTSCPSAFTCSTSNSKTATFAINTYTLTVNKAGNGNGTVSGDGTYNYGQTVTAVATASAGSTFAGWSGDCNSSGQVTMTSSKTCTATFTDNPPTLGSVTINSTSINPNNSTQYTVTVSGSDSGGTGKVLALMGLINYQGGNGGSYRGYLMWNQGSTSYWAGSASETKACGGGGGTAVIYSEYGPSYLHLDSCSISDNGNTRTVSFVVRFTPSFTSPTSGNDISGLVYDDLWQYAGWANFDLNFGLVFTPSISNLTISPSSVNPNNSNQYSIVLSGTDPGGASNITHLYTLINYQGTNGGNYRGYVTWYGPSNAWPGYQDSKHCSGVGSRAVIQPDYGNQYIHLDSCNISDSGNTRTATFVVRFTPVFTSPMNNNDISGYVHNTNGNNTGWVNFDTNFSLTFTPPTVPTISGAISGYPNINNAYTFTSTDPNGYQLRYGIDWTLDSVADEWLPAGVSYVNSGTPQTTNHSWTTTGTKQFKALAQNYHGTNSAWSSVYSVSVVDAPITGMCGSRNTTYPAGTTGWPGGSTYCSAGTPSAQPAFPAPGASVTWTCLGANGGDPSPTCMATLIQTTFNVTVVRSVGGKVESTDNIIKCGGSCGNNYNDGSTVTLQAIPVSSYWQFVRWTGDCSGTNPTCVLNVNSPKNATAIFSLRKFDYEEF